MKLLTGKARAFGKASPHSTRVWWLIAAILVAGTWLPSTSWTLNAQISGQRGDVVREDLVKKLTGKNFVVDKQTGRVRAATQTEARDTVEQLTSLLPAPGAEPEIVRRSNGTQIAHIDGLFNRTVIARPREGGTFETRCVATIEEAVAFLSGETAADLEDR